MDVHYPIYAEPWDVCHLRHNVIFETNLTRVETKTSTESQPHFNLAQPRVYINGADPKLATGNWQEVKEHIVTQKTDETRAAVGEHN